MRKRGLWARALADPATWGRALRVGAPVGLLQAAIHQGGAWSRLAIDGAVVFKTLLSPLVGFLLVWVGAAGALVAKAVERDPREGTNP